jgi:hypothetical protein
LRSKISGLLASALAVVVVDCGAAAWTPVDVGEIERARPKTLLLAVKEAEPLISPIPMRSAWMLLPGGAIGGAAAAAAAQQRNPALDGAGLEDPAERLANEIARSFVDRHALTLSKRYEPTPRAYLKRQAPRPATDLVLEVHTTDWRIERGLISGVPSRHGGANSSPPPPRGPVVRLKVAMRLLDGRTGRALAAGECQGDDGKAAQPAAPNEDALYANRAALLKVALTKMADRCIARFQNELLLSPPALVSPSADAGAEPDASDSATAPD